MDNMLNSTLFAALMFIGMLGFLEMGRRIGRWRLAQDPEGADKGIGAVDGAVFALFGLLLAFTFSGAATRFDHRRDLIVQEANAIGTAYLRVDLLPASAQPPLRALFRQYVEARLATYSDVGDHTKVSSEYALSLKLQDDIWKLSVPAAREAGTSVLVIPALNDMFDITTTRKAAAQTHPPSAIFLTLFGLGMAGSMLAGYGMALSGTRQLLHMLAFTLAITATVYVIMDLEYPRLGLIRIDAADQLLRDVLQGMK